MRKFPTKYSLFICIFVSALLLLFLIFYRPPTGNVDYLRPIILRRSIPAISLSVLGLFIGYDCVRQRLKCGYVSLILSGVVLFTVLYQLHLF